MYTPTVALNSTVSIPARESPDGEYNVPTPKDGISIVPCAIKKVP